MLPLPIYEAPNTVRPAQAEAMAAIVDLEFRAVTGRQNRIGKRGIPVVCASTSGISGYWSLECNDPDVPRETLDKIVAAIAKWRNSRGDPNRA